MTRVDVRDSNDGFTLVELLVVVAVIAILATLALTAFLDQRRKGWDAAVESDLRNAATVQHTVLAGVGAGEFAADLATLESAGFRPSPAANYFGGVFVISVAALEGETFCMTARSASGRFYGYSSRSGLVPSAGPLGAITCE
jgi:type IV pilus assembly protein PilA